MCKRLEVKMVPYEARHSGVSIDAALSLRTRRERQERGRWASEKSQLRYERRARLLQSFNRLPATHRAFAQECEKRLEAMLMLGGSPDALDWPRTRGW